MADDGAAFEIAYFASVVVLERESRCGYHSTGRSAASFIENYGNEPVRRLAMASRGFLESPPSGFCGQPLIKKRGTLNIGRADQHEELARSLDAARVLVPSIERLEVRA